MKKFITLIILSFLFSNVSHADFNKIKKKETVSKTEIIFPIKKDKKKSITDLYITPDSDYIKPILKVRERSG